MNHGNNDNDIDLLIFIFTHGIRVNTLGEENKILKRAVAIQESRQRELQSNNQQLELTLQQAVQHIQNLEKVINSLRTQLYGMSRAGPDFMLDKPPPDVY